MLLKPKPTAPWQPLLRCNNSLQTGIPGHVAVCQSSTRNVADQTPTKAESTAKAYPSHHTGFPWLELQRPWTAAMPPGFLARASPANVKVGNIKVGNFLSFQGRRHDVSAT